VKHGKRVKSITSPNPGVPTTFQLELAKRDTVTSITHIVSAVTLVADE
jgi:hypothetical protein